MSESLEFYEQKGFISLLVNSIPNIEQLSYLELGIGSGENLDTVNSKDKTSVDCDPNTCAQYYMTTDQFFAYNKRRYDIIFVDANHEYEQVLRDFQNALDICDKFIFLHDLFPVKEEYTSPDKCGDAYKLLYYLGKQQHLNYDMRTLVVDCGLTVIRLPINCSYLSPPLAEVKSLSYSDFTEWACREYQLYPASAIIQFLQEDN